MESYWETFIFFYFSTSLLLSVPSLHFTILPFFFQSLQQVQGLCPIIPCDLRWGYSHGDWVGKSGRIVWQRFLGEPDNHTAVITWWLDIMVMVMTEGVSCDFRWAWRTGWWWSIAELVEMLPLIENSAVVKEVISFIPLQLVLVFFQLRGSEAAF